MRVGGEEDHAPPLAEMSAQRTLLSSVAGAAFGSIIDPDLGFPEHLECLFLGEAALARKVESFDRLFTICGFCVLFKLFTHRSL
ncbi:hypothetical protein [Mesorhizobium sp.]|uniref:hypothetical protein n=1 Tax=Mesorhizobium sp. TaxID=1871066 RepID=UPI0025E00F7D|nr:hypothetical protein [Mesorhizobium sp.]